MATRTEKVNAGLFLLVGTLLLAGAIAIVTGLKLRGQGRLYTVKITKSVGGLREGSMVKYLGVPVGRVKVVDFPKDDIEAVRVVIEISKESTPIKTGTYATLSSNFLTGETSVELLGGSNEDHLLAVGSTIRWQPTTLMRFEDSLPGVVDELKRVVGNINALIGDENRKAIAKLVDDLDRLAVDLRGRLDPIASDVDQLRASVATAADSIAKDASGLRQDVTVSIRGGVAEFTSAARSVEGVTAKLSEVSDQLRGGTARLDHLVAEVERTAATLDRLLGSADQLVDENRSGITSTLTRLRSTARELERMLRELREDPSRLLLSSPPVEHKRGDD